MIPQDGLAKSADKRGGKGATISVAPGPIFVRVNHREAALNTKTMRAKTHVLWETMTRRTAKYRVGANLSNRPTASCTAVGTIYGSSVFCTGTVTGASMASARLGGTAESSKPRGAVGTATVALCVSTLRARATVPSHVIS